MRTLRNKLLFGLAPTLLIVLGLGLFSIVMFYRLGNNIDVILRENYRSVLAAEGMKEAIERMDSGLLFAMIGEPETGRAQYVANKPRFLEQLTVELNNITLPGEGEMAADLERLFADYEARAEDFFAAPAEPPAVRRRIYFERMLPAFNAVRLRADQVLKINHDNMTEMNNQARRSASLSIRLMIGVLAAAVSLTVAAAVLLSRSISRPIEAVTEGARALARGELDQIVASGSRDELGTLAEAFNAMARTLRDYRQAGAARLLRAQRTAQAAIDSFPDPVVIVDSTGAVTQVNPAARRILAVSAAHDAPYSWRPAEPLQTLVEQVLAGKGDYLPVGLEQVVSFIDHGQERFFLPRVVAIRDEPDGLLGAAVALVDVTKLHLADRLKSDMVSTVSHELKTPLTSVQMAVHLLLEEVVGPLEPKQVELLVAARHEADRILSMINDLLDLARIEQGKVALDSRPVKPRSLVEDAIARADSRAHDKGVTLEGEVERGLPMVLVDRERIEHVFDNLITNAIQHSPRGGSIRVGAAADGRMGRFSVEDDGEGIPSADLPFVFDKFHRVPSSRHDGGAGLGLAIVREIVVAHGGSVEVSSSPGRGARFSFTIPTASPEPDALPTQGGRS